jgi:uncharacterized repeat protein (TIGR03847 family)
MAMLEFDPPERFVAGAVGPPGQRTFFLQASDGQRLTTVSLEKVQVSVLGDRVNDLLDSLAGAAGSDAAAAAAVDNAPLDSPIEDEFRVNTLSLGWDPERGVLVIECHDRDPDETLAPQDLEEAGLPPEARAIRVVLHPDRARAFARRCAAVVAAGRPPCPFCGGPLDREGHICPRSNGYRR